MGRLAVRGFTLVEMITSLVILGILTAIVASFLQMPIQGYFDISRRAQLTDAADLALRRMTRELQAALPNSVRVTGPCGGGTPCYIEFLEVRAAGRYRAEAGTGAACPSGNDALLFGSADTCFTTLGSTQFLANVLASDFLVVYNLGPGNAGADAYLPVAAIGNRVGLAAMPTAGAIPAPPEDRFTFPAHTFPLSSPDNRFYIVSGPVTYECLPSPAPGAGSLVRHWGYGIAAAQPAPPAGSSTALLATGVTSCAFVYTASAVAQRNGAVLMSLGLSQVVPGSPVVDGVTLFSQAHVSNTP